VQSVGVLLRTILPIVLNVIIREGTGINGLRRLERICDMWNNNNFTAGLWVGFSLAILVVCMGIVLGLLTSGGF
jgi:hypothetical protein